MSHDPSTDLFLWRLFQQLRARRFPLSPDDLHALELALQAGYGWDSQRALRDLCCALWAKSREDQQIVMALLDTLDSPAWELPRQTTDRETQETIERTVDETETEEPNAAADASSAQNVPRTQPYRTLPPISLQGVEPSRRAFMFVPQFPLTPREVAQAWRRLRRQERTGPPVELDIEATIRQRTRTGVTSTVVMMPRRRNLSRLLLLVDRQGSMDPYHHFVEEICRAIQQTGRLREVALYYFHNVPVSGADRSVLTTIRNRAGATFDPILSGIAPLTEGYVYEDAELLTPLELKPVLARHAHGAAVVIISDVGAARGSYSVERLLHSLAFTRGLRCFTPWCVWLNPVPMERWPQSTAAQLARHVPTFPLNQQGMYQAVNVLRGHPLRLERPL